MSDYGFLTETDEEFLRGHKEYESLRSEEGQRYRMRRRLTASIKDLHLAEMKIEQRDIENVAEKLTYEEIRSLKFLHDRLERLHEEEDTVDLGEALFGD